MLAVNIQGYLCNEDAYLSYTLDTVCGTSENFAMIAIATVHLTIYFSYTLLLRGLFSSRIYGSKVPWASLERRIDLLKMLLKVLLTVDFMLDKQGLSAGYV